MRPFWLVLLIMPALAPWAAQTVAAEPQPTRRYARLEAMDAQARAAWVGAMLKRLDEANGVVLSTEAVAAQRARFQQMLTSLIEDLPDWQSDVARFETELAISQRAAIEHLSRRYRVENYRAFRGDRTAYEQRRRLLEQLLARWHGSDAPDDEQHKVVEWLIAATKRAPDSKNDWLPPLPNLPSKAGPKDHVLAQSGASGSATGASAATSTAADALLPDVNLAMPAVETAEAGELPGPRPSRLLSERAAPALPEGMVRPETLPVSLEVRLPLDVRRLTPKPLHVAVQPSLDDFGPLAAADSAKLASFSRGSWRHNVSATSPSSPTWSPSTPPVASAPPAGATESGDPLAFARMKIDRLPTGATGRDTSPLLGGPRIPEPGRLAAAPTTLPPSPAAGNAPSTASHRHPPLASTGPPDGPVLASLETPAATPDDTSGKRTSGSAGNRPTPASLPNIGELASRIKGNNVAMRKLAAELYEDRQWDARSLAAVLDRLAPLVARKDDLKLIRELVPAEERKRVGDLESGSELISDLGSKIARVRGQVQGGKFQGTLAERKAELDKLDQLSRRLGQLVFNDE